MTTASRCADSRLRAGRDPQAGLGLRVNHRPVLATKKDPVSTKTLKQPGVGNNRARTLRYFRNQC